MSAITSKTIQQRREPGKRLQPVHARRAQMRGSTKNKLKLYQSCSTAPTTAAGTIRDTANGRGSHLLTSFGGREADWLGAACEKILRGLGAVGGVLILGPYRGPVERGSLAMRECHQRRSEGSGQQHGLRYSKKKYGNRVGINLVATAS